MVIINYIIKYPMKGFTDTIGPSLIIFIGNSIKIITFVIKPIFHKIYNILKIF